VFEIPRKLAVDGGEMYWQRIQALFSERPIKPFNVCIVIRLTYPGVPMTYLNALGEVCTKL
jgi:hypothetical protein